MDDINFLSSLNMQEIKNNTNLESLANSSRWQDKYADPNWQNKLTKLDLQQEANFQKWAKDNKVPITSDYDMR